MQENPIKTLLEERARKLATRIDRADDAEIAAAVTVVMISNERFGLPIETLREVVPLPPICRLPGLPPHYPGMAQVRGEILAVLDPARLFGLVAAERRELVAVLDDGRQVLGLLVDGVVGSEEIARTRIAQEFEGARNGRHVRFVTRDLITVLDVRRLLDDEALVVGTAHAGG